MSRAILHRAGPEQERAKAKVIVHLTSALSLLHPAIPIDTLIRDFVKLAVDLANTMIEEHGI